MAGFLNLARKRLKEILMRVNQMTLPSRLSNVEYNRRVWDRYARFWGARWVNFEDKKFTETERRSNLQLGVEWGNLEDVQRIIAEYIYPYVTRDSVVGEIGSGGGRIAARVVERTKEFYCFDISSQMLRRSRTVLAQYPHVSYVLLDGLTLPRHLVGRFDFIYSFDVFVHLDLHTMWRYFEELPVILKAGGKAFIHTTNLGAPDGWKRFTAQRSYSVEGHYFISPEIVAILAERSGLRIVKRSTPDPSSFYLNRDYLVVLEKPR